MSKSIRFLQHDVGVLATILWQKSYNGLQANYDRLQANVWNSDLGSWVPNPNSGLFKVTEKVSLVSIRDARPILTKIVLESQLTSERFRILDARMGRSETSPAEFEVYIKANIRTLEHQQQQDRIELESVLVHELAHVLDFDDPRKTDPLDFDEDEDLPFAEYVNCKREVVALAAEFAYWGVRQIQRGLTVRQAIVLAELDPWWQDQLSVLTPKNMQKLCQALYAELGRCNLVPLTNYSLPEPKIPISTIWERLNIAV